VTGSESEPLTNSIAGFTTSQQQQSQANYIYQKQREGACRMM